MPLGLPVSSGMASKLKRLILYFMSFIGLKNNDLLANTSSFVSKRLRCVACQTSVCRAAGSADARAFGLVMGTIHKSAVRGLGQVVSYDETTAECVCGGIGVFQQHSELSTMSNLARNQANDLKAPCDNECSMGSNF
jgi:hypothetical protein